MACRPKANRLKAEHLSLPLDLAASVVFDAF